MAQLWIYFGLFSMGSLIAVWKVSGDPVCYNRKDFDKHSSAFSRVDCNTDPENVYVKFETRKDFSIGALIDGKPPPKNHYCSSVKTVTNVQSESASTEDCRNQSRNSCYLFNQTKMTWEDAKKACCSYNHDAHLVFIESDDENEFIIDLIENELTSMDIGLGVWLGLTKTEGGTEWLWYNTTADIASSGPRTLTLDGGDEVCVRINRDVRYEWHDINCLAEYFFICEWQI